GATAQAGDGGSGRGPHRGRFGVWRTSVVAPVGGVAGRIGNRRGVTMFGQLGQLAGLLRQLPKLKEEAEKFQAKLGEITAEGSAGDMVTVRANGRMEVLKVTLTDAAYALQDREMLEDMVAAATNAALAKARDQVNVEAQSMASGLGLPPGMDLP